jgi:type VI secretion system protein ImpB
VANKASLDTKDRVSIVFKSSRARPTSEDVELPFKMLVIGDFAQATADDTLENRNSLIITKGTFDAVLKSLEPSLDLLVDNRLGLNPEEKIPIHLKFSSMADFDPDRLATQVGPLKDLAALRGALVKLKNLLISKPELAYKLDRLSIDPEARESLLLSLRSKTNSK